MRFTKIFYGYYRATNYHDPQSDEWLDFRINDYAQKNDLTIVSITLLYAAPGDCFSDVLVLFEKT